MVRVGSNERHVRDLAPVSRENKRCTSQQTRITIVELVHRRPLADLVYLANFTVKRVNVSFISWEKQVLSLVDHSLVQETSFRPFVMEPLYLSVYFDVPCCIAITLTTSKYARQFIRQ